MYLCINNSTKMKNKKIVFILALLAASTSVFAQKAEGLAKTPPMGWNSWNTFSINISEELVKGIVDKMISSGLRDAGYNYVVLDDGWMLRERDAQGNLVPDPEKFPNGIKHLVDYVHSKGMKFGIYNCAGTHTCGGFPGSRGHEYQDARLYASWDIDFLKYDWCSTGKLNAEEAYITMRDALATTGRPILLSICEWGTYEPWLWGGNIGHTWRISGDIYPCFDCEDRHDDGLPTQWSAWGVTRILDMRDNDELRKHAKPGAWNDYDMLEVGNGMKAGEDRAHFGMWAMLASPLMLGNDVRTMSQTTLDILGNKEVIAIDQDTLGIQGYKYQVLENGWVEVWLKPLAGAKWAVCFLNRGAEPAKLNYTGFANEIKDSLSGLTLNAKNNRYTVRDAFAHKDLGQLKSSLKISIPSHDVVLLVLTKK